VPKKLRFADEIDERQGKIECSGAKVLQRWRASGGYIRISHLLMILCCKNCPISY